MTVVLRRIVMNEKKHSDTIRRGGAGRKPRAGRARGEGNARGGDSTRPVAAYHRTEMDLDDLISDQPLVEETVNSKIEYEDILEKANSEDLRTIFERRLEGYSIGELAGLLGVSVRTVERKLARIQRIYRDLNPERKAKEKGEPDPS
jgi:DNA-directed RNA polymerase specialized sigma24 family protein